MRWNCQRGRSWRRRPTDKRGDILEIASDLTIFNLINFDERGIPANTEDILPPNTAILFYIPLETPSYNEDKFAWSILLWVQGFRRLVSTIPVPRPSFQNGTSNGNGCPSDLVHTILPRDRRKYPGIRYAEPIHDTISMWNRALSSV